MVYIRFVIGVCLVDRGTKGILEASTSCQYGGLGVSLNRGTPNIDPKLLQS